MSTKKEVMIEIKGLGKRYNISHMQGRYVALRDILAGAIKNPFKFLIYKTKKATGMLRKEEFWALRDISLSVHKGEVIGIIGHNGAGKSTLLKILTGITPPTEGEIRLKGRVSSLLEVGTGFHPELTGRENIFLNGSILGMKRKEIANKFDAIVEFAGVDKFIDTPVKYYSSGMYVRLAFSVAAHMEPDILLVDEVLAVGDAEFQKKCLGKMEEVTKQEGRTIVFVSHNMGAIQRLCKKTLLLEGGKVKMFDDTSKVVNYYLGYLNTLSSIPLKDRKDRTGNGDLRITDCYIEGDAGIKTNQVVVGENMKLVFEYQCKLGKKLENIVIGANITNQEQESLFMCHNQMTGEVLTNIEGRGRLECEIKRLSIVPGNYSVNVRLVEHDKEIDCILSAFVFDVIQGDFFGTGSNLTNGKILVDHSWRQVNE